MIDYPFNPMIKFPEVTTDAVLCITAAVSLLPMKETQAGDRWCCAGASNVCLIAIKAKKESRCSAWQEVCLPP